MDLSAINHPIKQIAINSGLVDNSLNLLNDLNIGQRILIVQDANSYKVAGAKLQAHIRSNYQVSSYIFAGDIKATIERANHISSLAVNADYIIAVGSGTINDICKYASAKLNIPYVVFATAPSMNGYSSANASLIDDSGVKSSYPAHLPAAIYADLDILTKAPINMIQSGIGDMIARSTAQKDCLLAHLLHKAEYSQEWFDISIESEKYLLENISYDNMQQQPMVEALMENLIRSGLAMYIAGNSSPASGGEHMISHLLDSKTNALHGEQIAITTIYMNQLQEKLIDTLQNPQDFWDIHIETKQLKEFLDRCKISYNPQDLWDIQIFNHACKIAYSTRERFTFLNLQAKLEKEL